MDKGYGIWIISVTILVLCSVGTASATNWSVDGSGGADFIRIQEAINNASDGDTIMVHSGVYYENVVVDKAVTLKGIGHPVVDANGSGSAITLTVDEITLEGFTITNCSQGDAGIKIISSNNNITDNNVSRNGYGIRLYMSSNNTIINNNVSNNKNGIWLTSSCNNNAIADNNASNNNYGIYLGSSRNNVITGNNVSNNNYGGIYLGSSSNNTITGNIFVNDGLIVSASCQNTVEDNKVNDKPLVYLEDTSDIEITDAGQVILVNCNNITVEGLDLANTSVGVELWKTEDSMISNNNVSNNDCHHGIYLKYSRNNTITGNTVSNNNASGIFLAFSSNNNIITDNTVSNNSGIGIGSTLSSNNNIITGNTVSNNSGIGIVSTYSSNNTITRNNVSNSGIYGIALASSSNNTITGNTFVNDGLFVGHSYQNIVADNIVNRKPLVYLEDVSNYKIEDAGQVILVNCSNITIENLDLSNTSVGIELWNTEGSTISNNKVCNNSGLGIILSSSSNNGIYLNNFINNNYNFHSEESTNIWNLLSGITYTYNGTTYESCLGNYWDDYEGSDADGDGIGNTSYSLKGDKDNYPLMKPFENYIT